MKHVNPRLVLAVCALGLFIDGYDLYIAALAEPFIKQAYQPTPLVLGLIQSSALLGAIVGSISIGRLADFIGRKAMLLMNLIFFVVVALLSSLAWNTTSLIVFRFLIGFGVGADYPIVAAYLAEMITPKNRKKAMATCMFVNCVASPTVALVAYLLYQRYPSVNVWRLFFALGALPALFGLLLRAKLPESLTWKAINDLANKNRDYSRLIKPPLLRRTVVLCGAWFLMNIASYGLGLFTPSILHSLTNNQPFSQHADTALITTFFINSFIMLGALASIFVINQTSIIRLQRFGFLMSFIGLLLLALNPGNSTSLIFIGFGLFNFFINLGPGITTYYLPAVLYPSEIKASGHGLASGVAKAGAFVGTLTLPLLQAAFGTKATIAVLSLALLLGFWLSGQLLKRPQNTIGETNELLTQS